MSAAQRPVPDAQEAPFGIPGAAGPDDETTSLRSLLRVVAPRPEAVGEPAGTAPAPGALPPDRDWARLVERLQGAARHSRAVEAQAHEQDRRVQQLLDRVRTDMRGALDRAETSEARLRDAQARADADALIADARIRAAEERAEAAEVRARAAETWLTRVHETVLAEFDGLPEPGTQ